MKLLLTNGKQKFTENLFGLSKYTQNIEHCKGKIMKANGINLRSVVLTWTIITTTFFWTSSMRIFLKPEISSWSIFGMHGEGFTGDFWILFVIIFFALLLFYLEGRGRLRILYHILLVSWHLIVTSVVLYGSFQNDAKINFLTWGLSLSFIWLTIPFALFLSLTIALVVRELSGKCKVPHFGWTKINKEPFLYALLIFPVSFFFFRLGSGFNWLVKIAVLSTIFQWIFLIESIGRPYSLKLKKITNSNKKNS